MRENEKQLIVNLSSLHPTSHPHPKINIAYSMLGFAKLYLIPWAPRLNSLPNRLKSLVLNAATLFFLPQVIAHYAHGEFAKAIDDYKLGKFSSEHFWTKLKALYPTLRQHHFSTQQRVELGIPEGVDPIVALLKERWSKPRVQPLNDKFKKRWQRLFSQNQPITLVSNTNPADVEWFAMLLHAAYPDKVQPPTNLHFEPINPSPDDDTTTDDRLIQIGKDGFDITIAPSYNFGCFKTSELLGQLTSSNQPSTVISHWSGDLNQARALPNTTAISADRFFNDAYKRSLPMSALGLALGVLALTGQSSFAPVFILAGLLVSTSYCYLTRPASRLSDFFQAAFVAATATAFASTIATPLFNR